MKKFAINNITKNKLPSSEVTLNKENIKGKEIAPVYKTQFSNFGLYEKPVATLIDEKTVLWVHPDVLKNLNSSIQINHYGEGDLNVAKTRMGLIKPVKKVQIFTVKDSQEMLQDYKAYESLKIFDEKERKHKKITRFLPLFVLAGIVLLILMGLALGLLTLAFLPNILSLIIPLISILIMIIVIVKSKKS